MRIQTSRFGVVEITEQDVIDFPEGLLGFNDCRKFVLLDDPNDEIFAWLQSCEEPGLAFPVLEPELFTTSYVISLSKFDLECIRKTTLEGTRSFSIITIPEDPTQMTANLKAPVVINVAERVGRQCVLQDNRLAIREPIFSKLQQRVVQNPAVSIKSQALDWGVAVRLPEINEGPVVEN
ncbi:MAG: flagellar assembly protein FliW [Bdellovibrionaceae bacterium]|nr:flagellar assembly protein FliW [Pseudobdellovibrionaceae bacterium]